MRLSGRFITGLAAADGADLKPETVTSATRGSMYSLHHIRFRGNNRRAAERTRQIGLEPRVDAKSVKRVATERKKTELIVRLELEQTNGAISSARRPARDGGEGEQRERVHNRKCRIIRRNAAAGDSTRVGRGDGGDGGEMTEASAVEVAEEEAEGDREEYGDG